MQIYSTPILTLHRSRFQAPAEDIFFLHGILLAYAPSALGGAC